MPQRPQWNDRAQYDRELSNAATFGDVDTVRRRLAAGCNVNARDGFGGTPLLMAAANGGMAVARVLIEHGAEVNVADVRGVTPLYYFVARGDVDAANLRLDLGAVTTVRGGNGESLVHVAIRFGRRHAGCADLVRRLVASGLDLHAPDRAGVTPAQYAKQMGFELSDGT